MGEEKSANSATSYVVDSNRYADLGATDHIIGEHDKLVVRDSYNDSDQIYMANGSCMHIAYIGHSTIHTPCHELVLFHVLHVPQATKNLASVHRFTSDNNVFFELHPDFFLIKDHASRKTLLHGWSKGGLYPITCGSNTSAIVKHAFSSIKVSTSRWHAHLGHHSSNIFKLCLARIVFLLLEI
jgi:hypothetical protein